MAEIRTEFPSLHEAVINVDGCTTLNSTGETITVTATTDIHYFMDIVGHGHKYVIYKDVPESTGIFQTGEE